MIRILRLILKASPFLVAIPRDAQLGQQDKMEVETIRWKFLCHSREMKKYFSIPST